MAGCTLPFGVSMKRSSGGIGGQLLKTCTCGMLNKRPFALIRDEAWGELYEHYHNPQQGLLDLVSNHASVSVEIATCIRDGLLLAAGTE